MKKKDIYSYDVSFDRTVYFTEKPTGSRCHATESSAVQIVGHLNFGMFGHYHCWLKL